MSSYQQKPNSGSLWPNQRKEKQTHPDLTGTIEVDGKLYWISGWEKTSPRDGKLWISLSVKPKDAVSADAARPPGKYSQPAKPTQADAPTPTADETVPF